MLYPMSGTLYTGYSRRMGLRKIVIKKKKDSPNFAQAWLIWSRFILSMSFLKRKGVDDGCCEILVRYTPGRDGDYVPLSAQKVQLRNKLQSCCWDKISATRYYMDKYLSNHGWFLFYSNWTNISLVVLTVARLLFAARRHPFSSTLVVEASLDA